MNTAPEEFAYTVILQESGEVSLIMGDEGLWTSLNDAAFIDHFGDETVESGDLDDVVAWLQEHNYLPPGAIVDIEDETGDDDETGDEDEEGDSDD